MNRKFSQIEHRRIVEIAERRLYPSAMPGDWSNIVNARQLADMMGVDVCTAQDVVRRFAAWHNLTERRKRDLFRRSSPRRTVISMTMEMAERVVAWHRGAKVKV